MTAERGTVELSLVIPIYNGSRTIGPLVEHIQAIFATKVFDIILVNDGSDDESEVVCSELAEKFPQTVTFVHLSRNFGEHSAVLVHQGDICALPFANASFDVAVCSSVLYHQWVKDPAVAVRELHRVLRPGGLLLLNVPAFRFLQSAHDEAVMTAHRFTKSEIRQLLHDNGFANCRLTYWTTLLFPVAVIARTLGESSTGRDFHSAADSLPHRLFAHIIALELRLLKTTSLPIGVALFAAARKAAGKRNGI